MSIFFGAAFVIASLAAIVTAERAPRRIALPFKVVPVALLVGALAPHASEGARAGFVLAGLGLSLAGDVAIAFSFVAGLAAFLVAHVLYIAALGPPLRSVAEQAPAFLPALAVFAGMLAVLWRRAGSMRGPVVVYMVVICTMLGRASARALVTEPSAAATLFLAGAALFVISDAMIAIDRFVRPMRHVQAWILATYFAAQALIAASVLAVQP
jgi:uncharacterized membrane protein YhhN